MNSSPRNLPDSEIVSDAVIMSISDEQDIPPGDISTDRTLSDLGYTDTVELLSLAHRIEQHLKIHAKSLKDRVPFLLGENNVNLLKSATVSSIIQRIRGRVMSTVS